MSPRRKVLVLLGAVAAAISGVGLSAPAAEASSIAVQYSQDGVSPSSNVGLVSVSINASSPLTSLQVSIYNGSISSGTDQLDLTMSDFVAPANDGNGLFGTWTLSNPITTGQLNLGRYQVYVSATDQGGDQISNISAGPLYFLNVVQYPGFTYSGTSFSYDNQDVTFSGTAVVLAPDGTTTPLAGQTLTVAGEAASPTVVTGSDGAFNLVFQVTQSGYYWLYYAGDADTESNSTDPVQLTVTTFPVHLTAALKASHVKAGAPDSVSGTATYTDGGISKPLAGNTISLFNAPYYPGEIATASTVTDSNGKFAMPVPTTSNASWTLATTATLYFPQARTSLRLTVALANAITGFHARLSPFAVVTVSAKCVTATRGKVRIEYSAKPGGPWQLLGQLGLVYGTGTCYVDGNYGTQFSGHFHAKLTAAYYRAVYVATPNWQRAVSKSIYLHRLLTKITSFSVTPHTVARHGHITVSGRLWALGRHGRWHAYGHRKVIVVFRYRRTWYRYRYAPETNSSGRFRHRFIVYASSPFFAQYNGDATHFASASRRIGITMTAAAHSTEALPGTALPTPPGWPRPVGWAAVVPTGHA